MDTVNRCRCKELAQQNLLGKDDVDSFAFLAEKILNGNFDIVEFDVGSSGGGAVGRLDLLRRHCTHISPSSQQSAKRRDL